MRVSAFRSAACALIAAFAATAMAEDAKKPDNFKFEFHGFVGGSLFSQDGATQSFGEMASYATATPNAHRYDFSGDVRQSRLNLSIAGPKVFFGAIPSAVAEMDFNGGTAAGGQFANMSMTPRLRLAYAQLNWVYGASSTVIRFGQDTDLIQGGIIPASVGHVAQTLGYYAGYLGQRHPGVFIFDTFPLVADYKLELSFQVTRGQWNDSQTDSGESSGTGTLNTGTVSGTTATLNKSGLSFADSSGEPMFEARARIQSKFLTLYVAGDYHRVGFTGIGNGSGDVTCTSAGGQSGCKTREVSDVNAGIKLTAYGVTVQGTGYAGRNAFGLYGAIGQQQSAAVGDIHSFGAWGQVGYNLTPELSVWGMYGLEHLNYAEVMAAAAAGGFSAAPALRNIITSAMLRYMDGGFAIALEWTHFRTQYDISQPTVEGLQSFLAKNGQRSPDGAFDVSQYMLSGFYFF